MSVIRKELRRLADGISLESCEVLSMLRENVLKRDLVEGEEAQVAQAKVDKFYRKAAKVVKKQTAAEVCIEPIENLASTLQNDTKSE